MDPKKQRALVEYLMRQNRPVTAKELADFLNFSVRTVKSYISDINHDTPKPFVLSSNRGYEVYAAEAERYLRHRRKTLKDIPQNYEERAAYINRKFLTYHTDQLEIYDLADELCYSVETIRADFQKMNRSFSGLGIAYEVSDKSLRIKKPAARSRPGNGVKTIMLYKKRERSRAAGTVQQPVETDPSQGQRIQAMSGSGTGQTHFQRRSG